MIVNIIGNILMGAGTHGDGGTVVTRVDQDDLIVPYNTAFGSIPFPSDVNIVTSGGIVNVPVTFAQGSYSPTTPGAQQVVGTLDGDYSPISFNLSVIVLEQGYSAILAEQVAQGYAVAADDFKLIENSLYRALSSGGILNKRDKLFVLGSYGDLSSALVDWKNPTGTKATPVGGITHLRGLGQNPDGVDDYVNTQWNPSTQGVLFTQNNASVVNSVLEDVSITSGMDYGTRSATEQVILNSRNATIAQYIINNNTNTDVSGSDSRGVFIAERTGSTAHSMTKNGVTTSGTLVSVARPNNNMYIYARNNLGTAANFTTRTQSYWDAGAALTSGEKTAVRSAIDEFNTGTIYSMVIDPAKQDEVIGVGGAGTWDETSIFGFAEYKNGDDWFAFYGGTNDTNSSDPAGYSIGVFTFSTETTGVKDPTPLIDVTDFPAYQSLFPMDVWYDDTTVYLLVTGRLAGVIDHDTLLFTAPINDPTNLSFSNVILDAGGAGHFNHGASFFEVSSDPTNLYIAYAFKNVQADPLQINIARADKGDLTSWTVLHSNVVDYFPSGQGQVYPQIIERNGGFYMLYGRFNVNMGVNNFAIFTTFSTALSSFPQGKENFSPTGGSEFYSGYTSFPRFSKVNNNRFYFAGRRGGPDTSYVGIGTGLITLNRNTYI